MRKILLRILAVILILGNLLLGAEFSRADEADIEQWYRFELAPEWTMGVMKDNYAGVIIDDLNLDGVTDILGCSRSPFILNKYPSGEYLFQWYGPLVGPCTVIAAGDLSGDAKLEVLVATEDIYLNYHLYLYRGNEYQNRVEIPLHGFDGPQDIKIGDVNQDGENEILLAFDTATVVMDGQTYDILWQVDGKGGFQVEYGEIDGDPEIEIVTNSSNEAYILDAVNQVHEWTQAGGFGYQMDLGDVDDDGIDEIGYFTGGHGMLSDLYVFEAIDQTQKWHLDLYTDVCEIRLADTDGNQTAEVVIGECQWGSINGYAGETGSLLWSINKPENGMTDLQVGDVDNDDVEEIIWMSAGKYLVIADWETEAIEWQNYALDGTFSSAIGDIDLDGEVEIIAASRSSDNGYDGGILQVINSETHDLEWLLAPEDHDIYHTEIGQLDEDSALEIILSTIRTYSGHVLIYDGLSQQMEWESEDFGFGNPYRMIVRNLDHDPWDEIILGYPLGQLLIIDGLSRNTQREFSGLGDIVDFDIGDPDGDGVFELVVLTQDNVLIYDSNTGNLENSYAYIGGNKIRISEPAQGPNNLMLIINHNEDPDLYTLQARNGTDFSLSWVQEYPGEYLGYLDILDINFDGKEEYILSGGPYESYQGFIVIGSIDRPLLAETRMTGYWGGISDFDWSESASNEALQYIYSNSSIVQAGNITAEEVQIHQSYLPLAQDNPCLLLLWDDFSDPMSGWPVEEDDYSKIGYLDGEYQVLVKAPDMSIAATPGTIAGNLMLQADFRELNETNGSYGLIFGINEDWSELYTVEVAPNYGVYQLWHYSDAVGWELLMNRGWQQTRIFEMRLILEGALLTGSLNGQQVFTYTFGQEPQPGRVGVIGSSFEQPNLDVRVDNFGLWTGGCENQDTVILDMITFLPQSKVRGYAEGRFGIPNEKVWAGSR